MAGSTINIRNKKAGFEFHLLEKFVAGIVLSGTETKSIKAGKASIAEAYCAFEGKELFIRNMHVTEYSHGTYDNHDPLRTRKLMLSRSELEKLSKKIKVKGLTIVPIRVFVSEKGWIKVEIALAEGKKLHDKRHDIKARDIDRDMKRALS